MTLNGVFGPVAQGAWVGTWLPWNPGVGTVNGAAHRRLARRDRAGRDHARGPQGQGRQAPQRAG